MATLLLVEDDSVLARSFAAGLHRRIPGLVVMTAASYKDAKRAAQIHRPEVMVADYWLPDGNSIDLINELHVKMDSMQTIMISAGWDKEGRLEAEKLRTIRVLDKPFDLEDLVSAVKEALMIQSALNSSLQARLSNMSQREIGPSPREAEDTQVVDIPAENQEGHISPSKEEPRLIIESERFHTPYQTEKDLTSQVQTLSSLNSVLIVDNTQLHSDMCAMLFAPYTDCKVTFARNGKESLKKLKEIRRFDLIITEVSLPDTSGTALIEEMKQQGYGDIPVIMVSTTDREEDFAAAQKAGALGYVKKPWRSSIFRKLIFQVLSSKKTTDLSARSSSILVADFHEYKTKFIKT